MAPNQHEVMLRPEEVAPIVEKEPNPVLPTMNVTTYTSKQPDEESQDFECETQSGMRSLVRQAVLAFVVCLSAVHGGFIVGYSNILLPQLNTTNSSLHADMDTASSIAMVYTIASPLGSLLCGVLMSYIGRKTTMQLGFVIFIPGWLLITFAQNHIMIYIGIVIDGIAKGLTAGAPIVLLDELADPRIRGVLCCLGFVFMSLGIFLVSMLGVLWSWQLVAGVSAVLALVCLISQFFVVESPIWLARCGRSKAAERALNWVWGPGRETEAKRDLDKILSNIQAEERERISSNSNNWKMLLRARVLKPFLIIHAFNLFQIICGTNILIFFSLAIMQKVDEIPAVAEADGVDSKLSTVLISIVRVIFIVIACFLLFWINRRPLAIVSGIGCSLMAFLLGTFLYIQATSAFDIPGSSWIATALVLGFVAANTCGFFVLPSVMMGEVLPSKIRSVACGYIYAINDVGMCFAIKSFPAMSESLGAHGLFWIFAVASVACTLLVYLLLPETQGKSLEQIEDYFAQSNVMYITRKRHQSSPLVKRSTKIFS
ncbi:facilitated trehalose transporter Tret1-2 homolog [Periplaneta americana]|uniref:facilitated trehalose transporter Tret1-2 homolog n=1 Tax=Periplaneta americana TaxID=6978 RepID=UPI0037E88555